MINKKIYTLFVALLITASVTEYAQASQVPSNWMHSISAPLYALSPKNKWALAIGVAMFGMGALYQNKQDVVMPQLEPLVIPKSKFLVMQEVIEIFDRQSDLSKSDNYESLLDALVFFIADIDGSLCSEDRIELQIIWAYLSTARNDASRELMINKLRDWIEDQVNMQIL